MPPPVFWDGAAARRPSFKAFRSHPYAASFAAASRLKHASHSGFDEVSSIDTGADLQSSGISKPPRLDVAGLDSFYTFPNSAPDIPEEPPSPQDKSRQRTGQACDRCRSRKIKCDDGPNGCETCARLGETCTFTDRNTRRVNPRGHAQRLEDDNEGLQRRASEAEVERDRLKLERNHLADQMSRLQHSKDSLEREIVALKGILRAHDDGDPVPDEIRRDSGQSSTFDGSSSSTVVQSTASPPLDDKVLPYPRGQQPPAFPFASKHMGIPSSQGALDDISRMTGYNISVFGIGIDLTKHVSAEKWKERDQMSWKFFLRNLHSQPYEKFAKPPESAQLPRTRRECEHIVKIYMSRMNAWYPVIPRHQLDSVIDKIYSHSDPNDARLEPAEVCRIHGVMALVKLQAWSQLSIWPEPSFGSSEHARIDAFGHYIFTVKHFPYLLQNHSLDTLQAAVLLCQFLHQFPHPGAVWMMTHWSMAIALDMNLHRSVSSLSREEQQNVKPEDVEQRKRIFGSIFSMRIMSCGSFARPIELRYEDYDIEIPEPVNDTPGDGLGIVPDQRCSFRVGIEFMKLAELYRDTYNDVYALRPTIDYRDRLEEISQRHAEWRRKLPVSLQARDSRASRLEMQGNEYDYFAESLGVMDAKLTLTLRHPAIWRRPRYNAGKMSFEVPALEETLSINLQASEQILVSTYRLREMKSMEVTWSATTTYIAAMFTMLWVYLSGGLIESHLGELYHHLRLGLAILEDIGRMIGTDNQLAMAIEKAILRWHEVTGTSVEQWTIHQRRVSQVADRSALSMSPQARHLQGKHTDDQDKSGPMDVDMQAPPSPSLRLPAIEPQSGMSTARSGSEGAASTIEKKPDPLRRRMGSRAAANNGEEFYLDWELFSSEFSDQRL